MAKSIRSKVKKRFRTAKRAFVEATQSYSFLNPVNSSDKINKSFNAFKYPAAVEATFPQLQLPKPLDFRSSSLPHSGYSTSRNRRKVCTADHSQSVLKCIDRGNSVRGILSHKCLTDPSLSSHDMSMSNLEKNAQSEKPHNSNLRRNRLLRKVVRSDK